MNLSRALTDADRERYEWQLSVPAFGEAGQQKLKNASVLVSRCGGVGGLVAHELAAAGVGRLILAHGGLLRLNDLNRQLLMSQAGLGQPRVHQAAQRLRQLNPDLQVVAVAENITEENVARLMEQADLAVDCAPLFKERLLLNQEAVRQRKPLVDCAMYELEGQVTTILPGKTPCLACLYPQEPPAWKRQFPVLGAVAGTIGCLGAMEAIKVITGLGGPLYGQLLTMDLRRMVFRKVSLRRRLDCRICRELGE